MDLFDKVIGFSACFPPDTNLIIFNNSDKHSERFLYAFFAWRVNSKIWAQWSTNTHDDKNNIKKKKDRIENFANIVSLSFLADVFAEWFLGITNFLLLLKRKVKIMINASFEKNSNTDNSEKQHPTPKS